MTDNTQVVIALVRRAIVVISARVRAGQRSLDVGRHEVTDALWHKANLAVLTGLSGNNQLCALVERKRSLTEQLCQVRQKLRKSAGAMCSKLVAEIKLAGTPFPGFEQNR